MKRFLISTAAGLMLAGAMTVPAFAQLGYEQPRQGDQRQPAYQQQPGYQQDGYQQDGYQQDRYQRDGRDNDRRDGQDRRSFQDSRQHGRTLWRDTRRDARWDASRHNGYFIRDTWYSGPPPSAAYRRSGFQLGHRPWQRGDRLGDWNRRYVEVDYRQRHLRAPPRGYHYVQEDNGDVILAAIATGIIAAIIAGSN